jgi:hypothetical protein
VVPNENMVGGADVDAGLLSVRHDLGHKVAIYLAGSNAGERFLSIPVEVVVETAAFP